MKGIALAGPLAVHKCRRPGKLSCGNRAGVERGSRPAGYPFVRQYILDIIDKGHLIHTLDIGRRIHATGAECASDLDIVGRSIERGHGNTNVRLGLPHLRLVRQLDMQLNRMRHC